MPVAPTPPTKPTPPVAPEHAAPNTNSSSFAPAAAPAATTAPAANTAKQTNSDVSGVVNKIEGLGKAFQGNMPQNKQTQSKDAKNAEPVAASSQTSTVQTVPMASFDTQTTTQTSAATKMSAYDKPSSTFSYLPFFVILIITAVVLVGMRLVKNKSAKQRSNSNHLQKKAPVIPKEGLNVVAASDTKAPKAKSSFEVRV